MGATSLLECLMPLENTLRTQTYLVEDALSLADIAVALDLKQLADKVASKSCTSWATILIPFV